MPAMVSMESNSKVTVAEALHQGHRSGTQTKVTSEPLTEPL